jgi:hypothetical protein
MKNMKIRDFKYVFISYQDVFHLWMVRVPTVLQIFKADIHIKNSIL